MTSRNKNIVAVVVFLIVLFLCYTLAISNTVRTKSEYNALKTEESLFNDIPRQLSVLNEKNAYYDSLLRKYKIGGTSMQHNLLKAVNENADELNLEVIAFHEPHIFEKEGLKIHTYDLTVEGGYNDILAFTYRLEQQTGYGEVVSLNLEKKKNFRTGKEFLQGNLLVRNFD
ncbi:hypothetical protein ED312_08535 [Sinomicrobium pectinilyticum]|uniref:Uncharacterized protein n=1 Tax=Sinomicrobium pectinilyticum TaxID=1084421 RepID=A0A3N0EKS6_SINP1|nr:hypothetical protein [Sinomicrobium pectinilyticum]RNL88485.1 hypothetical protein ED312_08535 [Sinomicrobium pectinilyticum]